MKTASNPTAPLWSSSGVHPLVTIAFAAVVCLTAFTTDQPSILAGLIAALFCVLWQRGILRLVVQILLLTLSFFAIFIYLFQGFFGGEDSTVLLRVGPFAYRLAGVVYATAILLRLVIFVGSLLLVFVSNRPRVLIDSLQAAGLPTALGFLILATLQLAPRTQITLHRIAEAQRMRGIVRDGSFAQRARGFLPMLSPLVLSHLRQVEEQSLALEERGFGRPGRRTLRYAVPVRTIDRWALRLAGLTLILLLFHLALAMA